MKERLLFKGNKGLTVTVLTIVFLAVFLFQGIGTSFAAPTVVDGRILAKSVTGDTSEWVEIARQEGYSLIVRKNFINIYTNAHQGEPSWNYNAFGVNTNSYGASTIRTKINAWFNGTATGTADKLPANARLRDYTMQHNATQVLGNSNATASLTNGYSIPTSYQVGTGTDIAFALSFGEAAQFCSLNYYIRSAGSYKASAAAAQANFRKLSISSISGNYGLWLRSPGDITNTAGIVNSSGRVFQFAISSTSELGLIYPAVWVNAGIFDSVDSTPFNPADKPTGVNGRILKASDAGDTSNWVEIATNTGCSLIVRANFINIYPSGYQGNAEWQHFAFGPSMDYNKSYVRDKINDWFSGSAKGTADRLPANARLRQFSLQHNATQVHGTCCNPNRSLADGFSKPTKYQVGIGDDIAFALSYSESANFLSKVQFLRYTNPARYPSSVIAIANFDKVNIPGVINGKHYGMWLRSPGDLKMTAGIVTGADGSTFQFYLSPTSQTYTFGPSNCQYQLTSPNNNEHGLIYPALWVGSGIFEGNKGTVNVIHKDASDGTILKQDSYSLNPGNYGPYNAESFPGYGVGVLATGSAPASGTIGAGEVKTITYVYPKITPTVTVTYDPNGGVGTRNEFNVPIYSNYTIQDQGYRRSYFDFNQWNTKADGTGIRYTNLQVIYMTAPITLYAQWISPM